MKMRIVHAVAGLLVVTSITLAHYFSSYWLWLGIFVGLNLFQSSLTNFCPLEMMLRAAGIDKNRQ